MSLLPFVLDMGLVSNSEKTKGKKKIEIKIIENEDDRLSTLCGGEIFLLFSHRLVNLIHLVILQLNLSLNVFLTQANLLMKPLMLLLRLTIR
ncbi:hypothetical protein Goshw_001825 [Gossypium schwendimanii]|uniref:Uncharacterized protein n=1 Tax=Gossypium schwendimanii TaxID=34291 RepID=A0A7J9M9J4_GOSSC|nr:hypothetical protein [Gossypium schwendimanii]